MFAGRNISVTHLALSSVRVMATCAMFGQAAGTAAAIANRYGCTPREVGEKHINELQQLLIAQDQFIPGMTLKHNAAALNGTPSDARLVDGMDRETMDAPNEHSILLRQGESCSYSFKSATTVGAVRLVWDSNFEDDKRMRCDEGEDIHHLASSLAKAFKVEVLSNGIWTTVFETSDNYKRLNLIHFDAIEADEIRVTLTAERRPSEAARLFAFEPVD